MNTLMKHIELAASGLAALSLIYFVYSISYAGGDHVLWSSLFLISFLLVAVVSYWAKSIHENTSSTDKPVLYVDPALVKKMRYEMYLSALTLCIYYLVLWLLDTYWSHALMRYFPFVVILFCTYKTRGIWQSIENFSVVIAVLLFIALLVDHVELQDDMIHDISFTSAPLYLDFLSFLVPYSLLFIVRKIYRSLNDLPSDIAGRWKFF